MNYLKQEDGRPFRVVRIDGQDIAVHFRKFKGDEFKDDLDLSLYPTARVGKESELSSETTSALSALRKILRQQLGTRSRALLLTMNGFGNSEPQGTGTDLIGTRDNLLKVLNGVLDGIDQFEYTSPEESEGKKHLIATAKRLIASAMSRAEYPKKYHEDRESYYQAFGSIDATNGLKADELRSIVDEIMHRLDLEGVIHSVTEEGGKIWLIMNITVPSGDALKKNIEAKDWKNAK